MLSSPSFVYWFGQRPQVVLIVEPENRVSTSCYWSAKVTPHSSNVDVLPLGRNYFKHLLMSTLRLSLYLTLIFRCVSCLLVSHRLCPSSCTCSQPCDILLSFIIKKRLKLVAAYSPPLGDILVISIGIRARALLFKLHRLESKDVV